MDYVSLEEPTELRCLVPLTREARARILPQLSTRNPFFFLIGYVRVFDRLQLFFNFCWK